MGVTPPALGRLSPAITSASLVAAVTVVISLLEPQAPVLGLGVLYVVAIIPIALWYGAAVASVVSVASMAVFSYFFLEPIYNVDPGSKENWEVVLAFLVAALIVSQLAARSQREARRSARLADEQAALRRVATLVARGVPPPEVFAAVAREVGQLLGADATHMARYGPSATATGVAAWSPADEPVPIGTRVDLEGDSVAASVWRTERPARVHGYEHATGTGAAMGRELGLRSSVGAPIIVDQHLWGVMIASSKGDRTLPPATESRIAAFTELVATAISNTEARSELGHLADEQAALRRVATLVARGTPPEELFAAVVEEVGRVLPVEHMALSRFESDDTVTTVAISSGLADSFPVGGRYPLGGKNVSTVVAETGRSARIDDYDDASGGLGVVMRDRGLRSSVGAPIVVEGHLWGQLSATSTGRPLATDTEGRLVSFAELVATAIANAESRAELMASRARVVTAADETRRRIERDLHDGIQQRLVALMLELRAAIETVPPELEETHTMLSGAAERLASVFDELREISRGIHPAVLSDGGLKPALHALCRRSVVPVELDVHTRRPLPERVEVATYYVVSEALTNAAKHAHASVVSVELDTHDSVFQLAIRDDGIGGADLSLGSGLVGLSDRVEALGGTLRITSPPDDGTTLLIEVPLDDTSTASS